MGRSRALWIFVLVQINNVFVVFQTSQGSFAYYRKVAVLDKQNGEERKIRLALLLTDMP